MRCEPCSSEGVREGQLTAVRAVILQNPTKHGFTTKL